MPNSAYELNLEYGLIDPDELEDIGTEEERSEALVSANLPSLIPSRLDLSAISPPEEAAPTVPTGIIQRPSIPRAEARIQPIVQPTQARGPIFKTAEAILSPAEQLNREYGLTPQILPEGIIPKEYTRPESPATRLNREMGLSPLTRPIGETRDTQEPGVPVSTIFKDLMVPIEPPPPPEPKKPGLIKEVLSGIPHGILQVGEIAGGLGMLAGEITGIEAIERVGSSLHRTFKEMNEKFAPSVAGLQDIESVGDAARYLGHGFASMLPFMVGTFGVGAAIRGIVTKTVGKAIAERAAAKAIIGFSSLAAASTVAETGIIAGERIDEGMKALSTNLLWAIPAGLMDALPQWRLLGKLGWFGRTITEKAERVGLPAARQYFLKEVGKQGFFEGITESAQEIFEAAGAERRPFSYETLMQAANAFIIAGFTGGVLGGAATLLEPSPRKVTEPSPVEVPPLPQGIDLLRPVKPEITTLFEKTVFRDVREPIPGAEEKIVLNHLQGVWGNFFEGVRVWPNLDIKDNQIVIKDSIGGQLSFNFNDKQSVGKEFLPDIYTDKNGISTKLSPDTPLPQSLKNTIIDGLAFEKPEARVEAKQPWEMTRGEYINFSKNILSAAIKTKDGNIYDTGRIHELPEGINAADVESKGFIRKDTNEYISRDEAKKITGVRAGEERFYKETTSEIIPNVHKEYIKQALSEGKPIPPEVLKDYPGLTKEVRGAGVTAGPTPPGPGLVPATTPFIEEAKIDLLHKEVVEPAPEPIKEVPIAPAVPPGLPRGFFEAVIMFDENGAVSVRVASHEGAENIPGFLGKVIIDAKKDTVYTPEMIVAKNAGEAVDGIARSKIEALKGEGFRPAFQELLPGERFRAREEVAVRPIVPPFYHLSEVIINSKMTGPMSSTQILKMLQNAGVKQDELVWTGLDDLLKQPKKFTKQEVLDFIKQNEVKVEEVVKGETVIRQRRKVEKSISDMEKLLETTPRDSSDYSEITNEIDLMTRQLDKLIPELDTKFAQWQLPGGENYRELLLTLPGREGWLGENVGGEGRNFATREEATEFAGPRGEVTRSEGPRGYRAPHWTEPNVLAHVRFNNRVDAQGKKVLFIEEVQSDWHQTGREEGYQRKMTDDEYSRYVELARRDLDYSRDRMGQPLSAVENFELNNLYEIYNLWAQGVPPAPFSKAWHELMMKRMVRWAAENGFDKIAWTTGEQQAARYDLSKQVEFVTAKKWGDVGKIGITVRQKGGERGVDTLGEFDPSKLPDIVGKDLAAKIVADLKDAPDGKVTQYSGLDLKVGGEGMKGFYDKILVDYMNKLGKKWGVKVGETEIPTLTQRFVTGGIARQKTAVVHSLDITPAMKESVLFEGQPLFREAMEEQIGQPLSVKTVQGVIDNFSVQIPTDVLSYEVPSSISELPSDILKRNKVTGKTQALYDRVLNKIYVIADRHTSEQDVLTSISHELFAHFGFERLFGPARMNEIVQEVHKLYGKEGLAYLYQAYNKIPGSPDGDYTVAIEKIAELAGTGENPGLWKRFVYWFRYYATKLFGPIRFSEDDIRAYLWRSRILIQQESFQDQVRKYNAFVKLTGAKMWDNGLPIGPLGARFAMREDTSPSHESAAENFTGFWGWYEARKNRDKNFAEQIFKKLGIVEATASLPHWISMNHPSFKPVTQVQWDRMDEKNRDRLYLLQDPTTNQGNNSYIDVDLLKNTAGVDPLIVWSDRNNIYLEDDEILQGKARELIHRDLSGAEVKAYHGWKEGFDRAVDYAVTKLRQLAVDFYSKAKWFDQLKGVRDGSIPMDQIQLEGVDLKDFQRALKKVDDRMKEVDRIYFQLKKFNFYAPHVRGRGDYVVRVKDVDEEGGDVTIWRENFDDNTQAEKARMRLANQYKDLKVEKTIEKQTSEFVFGGLNFYAMTAFLEKSTARAVGEGKISEEEADTLLNAVFKSANDEIMARGFRQHYIRRKQGNIGGYREENLRQVFYDYMSGLAGSMAKLDATRKFSDAIQNINKPGEPEVYEYASRYAADMLRNPSSLDNKINALKTLPYLWYISMNLRLAATQMFQNGITAYPILSRVMQELGVEGHASTELAKAMKDLAGTLSAEETTMLQNAYNDGETMAHYIQTIKGDISRSWAGKYFTKFVDIVSYPFAGMERFNRKSSLLAAFRVARRAGQTETEAYDTAKEFIRSAHYAYGLNNFPQLLRDGTPFAKIAGLGYVFKSFPHNYVLSMIHYAKNKEGKLALGVLMRSLAMLTILGGLGAAPFIDDLLEEFEQQTGYPARSVIRKSLDNVGGPLLASAGMEGILALVGLDMSGSTKIQVPIPGVGEYDPSTLMMGVYGGLIDKGKNAISFAANNQWMRAVESALPAGPEIAMKSYRLTTEGLRTAAGKPILDEQGKPIKATPYEVAIGLAGFRPQRIAEVQKERRVAQNIKDAYTEKRKKIIRRMRLATTPEERQALAKDIQSYNLSVMKYGNIIPKIGAQSIKQAMKPERGYMAYKRLYED